MRGRGPQSDAARRRLRRGTVRRFFAEVGFATTNVLGLTALFARFALEFR